LNELELISRCKDGDMKAFDLLVQPHLVMAFRTSVLIIRDHHLAQDAVQNALIEAYQTLYRFIENQAFSFRPWFYKIVVFRSLNIVRQKRPVMDYFERMDAIPSTIEMIVQNEEKQLLWQAIQSMNVEFRTVLILHYFEEFKIDVIAKILNIRQGTVKFRMHKARKMLKQLLSSQNKNNLYLKELRTYE
jgi:RNA polymerase sigma factor (sigma-70 family)